MADNKLRGAGSESIERDRPDIYSDRSIRRQERGTCRTASQSNRPGSIRDDPVAQTGEADRWDMSSGKLTQYEHEPIQE